MYAQNLGAGYGPTVPPAGRGNGGAPPNYPPGLHANVSTTSSANTVQSNVGNVGSALDLNLAAYSADVRSAPTLDSVANYTPQPMTEKLIVTPTHDTHFSNATYRLTRYSNGFYLDSNSCTYSEVLQMQAQRPFRRPWPPHMARAPGPRERAPSRPAPAADQLSAR